MIGHYADWLESQLLEYINEGDEIYFVTLTSQFALTKPSARRLFERWKNRLVMEKESFWSMFVMEDFELKDGCHIHAMVSTTATKQRMKHHWRDLIGRTEIDGKKALARTDFRKYKIGGGARGYCCKYILKDSGDYDITERYRTPLQNVKHGTTT